MTGNYPILNLKGLLLYSYFTVMEDLRLEARPDGKTTVTIYASFFGQAHFILDHEGESNDH
jgi:hypothetical protein